MKILQNIIILSICFALSLLSGFITYSISYELTNLDDTGSTICASGAFIFVFIASLMLNATRERISDDDAQDLLLSTANNLERAKIITALFSFAFGASAALVAAQTVYQADSGSLRNNRVEYAIDRYKELGNRIDVLRATETKLNSEKEQNPTAVEQISSTRDQINFLVDQQGQILASSAYQAELKARNERQVDGIFVFDFFSSVLVRFGTIFILLYIFSILIGEYRRLDRRQMEMKQILLAKRLNDQGISADSVLKIRKSLEVDDTPRVLRANKSDLIITESFSDLTSKTATAILESAGNALRSSLPNGAQKSADQGDK